MTTDATPYFDTAAHRDYLALIDAVIRNGPYDAEWSSLQKVDVPRWYREGKFGIFIHWGVFSVPAHRDETAGEGAGGDWYGREMYQSRSETFRHHCATYGPQSDFGYKDLVPALRGENFDPNEWATLFRRAGARFVVPVAEHHDGFAMYKSEFTPWNAAAMGPQRDVLGELRTAVTTQSMTFGASSHRAENWWFFNGGAHGDSDVLDVGLSRALYGPAAPETLQPDKPFLEDWLVRTAEIIDRYQPSLLWFDWWIEQPAFEPYLRRLAAFYYNRGVEWDREVAINYKFNAFAPGTAVLDIERGQVAQAHPEFWQNDTSLSKNSWSHINDHKYKTVDDILGDLIDIVSKNGALLLNVGPTSDGRIPDEEAAMLLEIGNWLDANGEAIYGTEPWDIYGEGPTRITPGTFNDVARTPFTRDDIRFSTARGDLYAAVLGGESGDAVVIRTLGSASPFGGSISRVQLLADGTDLEWAQGPDGLTVELPGDSGRMPVLRIRFVPPTVDAPRIPPLVQAH
ncbi:alpha-L-fucosidase [Microbacterium sp. Be9]|uniref:alpha-L-fucosidase n=1 Tax=Microbacterium sp. Be9 TaxID=2720211 RepID=UPI00141FA611|nr:alpha-L-fucosidase [Microbacterium sp. Be9]NIG66791.1 alpha-L-fucosidase [Microbacterium sp. Be9]